MIKYIVVNEILIIGVILILGQLFAAMFQKTRMPDVLPLMLLGFLLGPVLRVVSPLDFGSTARAFTTITLIVVLFITGSGLRISAVKGTALRAVMLTLSAFSATAAVIFLSARLLLGVNRLFAVIIGVIAAYNSFIIIVPVLKNLNVSSKTKAALSLESTLSSVLTVVLTLTLFQFAAEGGSLRAGGLGGKIIYSLIISALAGVSLGVFWTLALNRVRQLKHSTSLIFAFLLLVYSLCVLVGGKGEVGVLFFGFTTGNIRAFKTLWFKESTVQTSSFNSEEKSFFSEIEFILKTLFFVYMGICMEIATVWFAIAGGAFALIKLFIRIPAVNYCFGKDVSRQDAAIALAMCPGGLVSAALATAAAQRLEDGIIIQDTIYAFIFFSIILTSVLSFMIEKGRFKRVENILFKRHFTPDVPQPEAPAPAQPGGAPHAAEFEPQEPSAPQQAPAPGPEEQK